MQGVSHGTQLRRLRDRLSDLSMRNRSLRMVRLPKKRAFDLAWLEDAHPGDGVRLLDRLLSGTQRAATLLPVGVSDPVGAELHRGLTYLEREVRLVEAERGVYDLSVGFPFVRGLIADGKYLQAPLFLLPRRLELTRRAPGAAWTLTPIGEPTEVRVNRTLLLALQRFRSISIDADALEDEAESRLFAPRPDGLGGLLRRIVTLLGESGWSVGVAAGPDHPERLPRLPELRATQLPTGPAGRFELHPHAVLSRFPLADTALLSDYDQLMMILDENPAQPLGYAAALLGERPEARDAAPVSPTWHVEPMDESQMGVLGLALAGRSLAVHGPPGTGKSQFIANLVANSVADGKKVLVVSQKRAALDVVAQRLGDLRPLAALVHDPVRDRDDVCAALVAALGPERDHPGAADERRRSDLLASIDRETAFFQSHHDVLVTDGPDGSPFDAYVERLRHPGTPARVRVRDLPTLSPAQLRTVLPDVTRVVRDLAETRTPGQWLAERPDYADRGRDDLDDLVEELVPAIRALVDDVAAWERRRPAALGDARDTAANAPAFQALADWAAAAGALSGAGVAALAALGGRPDPEADHRRDADTARSYVALRRRAQGQALVRAAPAEVAAAVADYQRLRRHWCRFLMSAWTDAKKRASELAHTEEISGALDAAVAQLGARQAFGAARDALPGAWVVATAPVDVDRPDEAVEADLVERAHAAALAAAWPRLPIAARRGVPAMPSTAAEIARAARLAAFALDAATFTPRRDAAVAAFAAWVGHAAAEWIDEAVQARDAAAFDARVRREVIDAFDALNAADRRRRSLEASAPELLRVALDLATWAPERVEAEIGAAYAERWVRDAEARAPTLRDLTHAETVKRRAQLGEAWDTLPAENRRVLRRRWLGRIERLDESSIAELRRRAEQKRRKWPLRAMVAVLWEEGLSTTLPVWLCSPETVAAVFPLRRNFFDVVVFDEASQCTLSQGLTVAYRGRTCIVAGDEQQLPPTSLFSTSLEEEDDEALDDVVDEESLLSRAKAAGHGAWLSWHYRSRFPELIEFSNRTFYQGTLKVAPVPVRTPDAPAVEWVAVDGQWIDRANRAEAEAAVGLLARFLAEHPTLSVGVITLNRQQSDLVQDLVDARLASDAAFRARYEAAMARPPDERPFLRNLENVQGDERDVIVLSVAYAPDASGRVPLRFGALSQPGGARRLNVAVSRARLKLMVVCSFEPSVHLQVAPTAAEGARVLAAFLEFARAASQATPGGGGAGDPRHTVVCAWLRTALEARGWRSEISLGTSAARVDVAVRSRSDDSRFLLGVLLDGPGAGWAHTPVGREVGRIRYLERYHWRVERVETRDLVRQPDATLDRLVARLESLERAPTTASTPPRVSALPPGSRRPSPAPRSPPRPGPSTPGRPPAPDPAAVAPGRSAPPPAPAPAGPPVVCVVPGSRVRYRRNDTGGEREIVVATGDGDPPGALPLASPIVRALSGAEVGETVTLEIGESTVDLEVLEITPPT